MKSLAVNLVQELAARGVTAFALELIPRITRAQSMDILSSQANLAGYKAVLDAAVEFGKAFPMMMTAAGTVKAARVLILGAGVAGLTAHGRNRFEAHQDQNGDRRLNECPSPVVRPGNGAGLRVGKEIALLILHGSADKQLGLTLVRTDYGTPRRA